jgi:hypothetical protein
MVRTLVQQEADVSWSVLTITKERMEAVDFLPPYLTETHALVNTLVT